SAAAPSSGVKNTHGPGLTAWGGSPANGRQGIPVPPAKVRAPAVLVISSNAVEASNDRRLVRLVDGPAFRLTGPPNEALTGAELVDIAFPSLCGQAIADPAFADRVNDASRPKPSQ